MCAKVRRNAFTLIEVLIVVVIMAVLAATIIPQFSSSADDAKKSALKYNLHSLRSQIEMYKMQHNGTPPALVSGSLPGLTSATNAQGTVGAAGPTFPFGPYIQGTFPANPFDNKNVVVATDDWPATGSTSAGGWLYHADTGNITANTDDHFTD